MSILSRISRYFTPRRRSVVLSAVAVFSWITGAALPGIAFDSVTDTPVISMGGMWMEEANAKDEAKGTPGGPGESPGAASAQTGINTLMEIIMMVFLPGTVVAGWLLSPDWTLGQFFGIRTIIHSLWVMIANIVYVIFAFILVGIAFMNVFGIGQESFSIKRALPRFAVGVLIVPMTWWFVGFVLAFSNIMTASVLRLPADLLQDNSNTKPITFKMPTKCTLNFAAKSTEGKIYKCEGEVEKSMNDVLGSDKGAFGILNVYAYAIFNIQDYKSITADNIVSVKGILDIITNVGVWALFLLAFALLVIALVFALLTRAFYLWLIAIFSPLFGLFYFLDHKGKFAQDMEKHIGIGTFIGLAMVPVYVAAALSFGLLFLKLIMDTPLKAENSSFFNDAKSSEGKAEVTVWPTVITVEGTPVGQVKGKINETAALGASALGKIIMAILGLVVLWMAVMAALSSSEITKSAVAPIASFGSQIGGMIKEAPQHIPIPLGGGKSMSAKGLETFGSGVRSGLNTAAMGDWNSKWQGLWSGLGEAMGHKPGDNAKQLGAAANALSKLSGTFWKDAPQIKEVQEQLLAYRWDAVLAGKITPEDRGHWKTLINKVNLDANTKTALNTAFDGATDPAKFTEAIAKFNKELGSAAMLPDAENNHFTPDELQKKMAVLKERYPVGTTAAGAPAAAAAPTTVQVTIGTGSQSKAVQISANSVTVPGTAGSINAAGLTESQFRAALNTAGVTIEGDQTKIVDALKATNFRFN